MLHPLTNGVGGSHGGDVEDEEEKMDTSDTENKTSKKKRVSWADDRNLVSIHYFEMDESERGMQTYLQ